MTNGLTILNTVLFRRAERLGISVDELLRRSADDKKSLRAQVKQATRRNVSLEQLLEEEFNTQYAGYPTQECLFPSDFVQAVKTNAMSQLALKHIKSCESCRQLLEAMHPRPELIADFTKAMQATVEQAPVKTA